MSDRNPTQSLSQLALNLSSRLPAELDNFVEPDGAHVVTSLRRFLSLPEETIVCISGGAATGKSHLLLGVCQSQPPGSALYLPMKELLEMGPQVLEGLEQSSILCFDDLDEVAADGQWEEALFHLFNRCQHSGCKWIVAMQRPAGKSGFELADLVSRLGWGMTLALPELDDTLRLRVLDQQAQHFGFRLSDEVRQFIIRRAPRDLGSLTSLMMKMDQASLQEKRAITVPFVKAITGW